MRLGDKIIRESKGKEGKVDTKINVTISEANEITCRAMTSNQVECRPSSEFTNKFLTDILMKSRESGEFIVTGHLKKAKRKTCTY